MKIIRALRLVVAGKTLKLWHGGNLEQGFNPDVQYKKGRWEHGPGLYLTTHYDTARKYGKGSRKLYEVEVREGTDIQDAYLDFEAVKRFVDMYVLKKLRDDVLARYDNRAKDGKVPATIFMNVLINEEAIRPANTQALRKFLVEQGVDYSILDNLFGWHERAVVVFNPDVIVNVRRVDPKEKIETFDLPTDFR